MIAAKSESIQPRAQAALTNSPFYELRDLQVDQLQDALRITGCVSSYYHKQLAQEVVRSVCSEVELLNSIRVVASDED